MYYFGIFAEPCEGWLIGVKTQKSNSATQSNSAEGAQSQHNRIDQDQERLNSILLRVKLNGTEVGT